MEKINLKSCIDKLREMNVPPPYYRLEENGKLTEIDWDILLKGAGKKQGDEIRISRVNKVG